MCADSYCFWCEKPLPKKPHMHDGESCCSQSCVSDSQENKWPSWMVGRIGPDARQDWHMTGDYLCVSAPNRYRQMFRKRGDFDEIQAMIIERQKKEYAHLENPLGLDFDFPSFDQVLIWEGPVVSDAILCGEIGGK